MTTSDYYIQDNTDIEEKKLEAAKNLFQTGNYSNALKLYLDMVNTSYSYKLNFEVGRCYYKLNDFDNAEEYFMRSVSLERFKNPSFVFLGNIFYKREDISKAIECWCTAYSYKPEDESVCLNLATSYFSKDMKFQSVIFYEKFLKYAKDKTTNYYLEIKKSIEDFAKQSASIGTYINKTAKDSNVQVASGFIKPIQGRITSPFGWRTHPIFNSRSFHSGIDIGGPNYGDIKASNSGKVIYSGWYGGYGKVVILEHGIVNGKPITTLYAHMSSILVSNGQRVNKGQVIGKEGTTGYSTGPHCHFEVRVNGQPNNPLNYI